MANCLILGGCLVLWRAGLWRPEGCLKLLEFGRFVLTSHLGGSARPEPPGHPPPQKNPLGHGSKKNPATTATPFLSKGERGGFPKGKKEVGKGSRIPPAIATPVV